MGNQVYIRCDGSKEIGMGHLNRAVILAGMLKTRFGLTASVIMKKNAEGAEFLSQRGLQAVPFEGSTAEEEFAFLQGLASSSAPALLVLDVLDNDVNPPYMKGLSQLKCPIVAITDDSDRRLINAHIVVNGNPRQNGMDYSGESGTYLAGSKYFLMEETYRRTTVAAPKGKVRRILLTLGGSDHHNLIFNVLDALKQLNRLMSLLVVSSQATGYLDRLKQSLKGMPFANRLVVDAPSLYPFWSECDVAITSGGNTLFERIASRLPGATLCQLPRQMEIAHFFAVKDVNINLGYGPDVPHEELKKRLIAFMDNFDNHRRQYDQAPQFVNGRGLEYLGDEIQKVLTQNSGENSGDTILNSSK